MEIEEVKQKAIKSVSALIGRTVFLQIISLCAVFFLGIFLPPSAVGVYIVVSSLMRIFTIFTDIGFGAALVQKHLEIDETDLKTVFTIQEGLVLIAILLGFLATPLVRHYASLNSDGVILYYVLLATLFISSLKAIPSILMERKLAFDKQVIPQIVESLVFNAVLVFLAYKQQGTSSYSWAVILSSLIGLPIYYILSPWRVSLGVSWDRARALTSYGIQYQGKSVLAIIKDDLLIVFLSGVVGNAGIGYWGWWQRWAYSPFRLIVDSVTKVTFPAYSRIQHDKDLLGSGIEKSIFAVSFLMFPILSLMALMAGKMLFLIPKYAKWEPGLNSFYFLCAGAALSSITSILVNALDATGKVRTTLMLMIFWIAATWITTLFFVSKYGFTGISIASFIVSTTIVVVVFLVKRHCRFSFLANIIPQTLSCAVMIGIVSLLQNHMNLTFTNILVWSVSGGIIYLVAMFILAREKLQENLKIAVKAFKK